MANNYLGSIESFLKYKPLIHELVIRDLKVKYRRSFLGYLWSLLNPLLMMLVMSIVFGNIFRGDIENFPVYVICGQTLFGFFTESTTMSMYSILNNAALVKKIYIPKPIFPISRVISCFVTMSFSLGAVIIVMIFTGTTFHWTILLSVIPIFLLLLFCCGIGMVLAALSVFFRDITHLWGVITLAWMYGTPVFYSVDLLPDNIRQLIQLNPMYYFLTVFRKLMMAGSIPEIDAWRGCILASVGSLIIGLVLFHRLQNDFILHI